MCKYFIINVLWLQLKMEGLVFGLLKHDSLSTLLSAFVIDNSTPGFDEGGMGGSGGSKATVMAVGTTKGLRPRFQILDLKLENIDYEEERSILLPLHRIILEEVNGPTLRSFKASWRFGEREEQLVL